jgi:hypothetical protein
MFGVVFTAIAGAVIILVIAIVAMAIITADKG